MQYITPLYKKKKNQEKGVLEKNILIFIFVLLWGILQNSDQIIKSKNQFIIQSQKNKPVPTSHCSRV